jgi:acyl-CoA thioester hydrolase
MNEVQHLFQVMTYDIDAAGVLSNVVYVRWLEDLRNLFAEKILPIGEAYQRHRAGHSARGRLPVPGGFRQAGRPHGPSEHGAHGSCSRRTASQRRGEVTVRAKQIGVFVDIKTLKPVALPAEFRALGPTV